MTVDKRAKRAKRENRASKKTTWYCAGCQSRHPKGARCPSPRLFASQNGRTLEPPAPKPVPKLSTVDFSRLLKVVDASGRVDDAATSLLVARHDN